MGFPLSSIRQTVILQTVILIDFLDTIRLRGSPEPILVFVPFVNIGHYSLVQSFLITQKSCSVFRHGFGFTTGFSVVFEFTPWIVRIHISRGLSLRRTPCGFQSSVFLAMSSGDLRSVRPIHLHFRFCIVLFILGVSFFPKVTTVYEIVPLKFEHFADASIPALTNSRSCTRKQKLIEYILETFEASSFGSYERTPK